MHNKINNHLFNVELLVLTTAMLQRK